MAAGAEFWVTYQVTDSNDVSYTPYSEEISSSLSSTPETVEFSDSSVTFYDNFGDSVGELNFPNPYTYNGVSYQLEQIHFNGVDAINETFDVPENGCQIVVYYGYDPETGGSDVGGPDQGENPPGTGSGDEDPDKPSTETPDVAPIQFSFTVKSYKEGTVTEVDSDFSVEECYYLERYDEGTVGDYGLLNLKYYTGYDSYENIYTEEQTYTVPSTITGYKLSGFHGIENGQSLVGEKDGINNYTFEAYYIVNSFKVTIDAKGIDRSQVTVQDPNHTNLKYNLRYEGNFPNQTLLLEAITSNEGYEFDYWEVNGEKIYYGDDILRYEIESDLEIYCCFKEKITPDDIEDDKIATNDDIHTIIENSSLYPINNDENSDYLSYRCPTKYDILNNNYTTSGLLTNAGQLINIIGVYDDDQCVKFEDISFNSRKIKIQLYNDKDKGIDALGDTIVTFYASGDTQDSISEGDTKLIYIDINDYKNQTGKNFDSGDSINVEYTLPNYNIFDMYIKIKIRGKYGATRAFRTYCKNSSTTNWMDQSDNVLPGGSIYKDTVKGYSRKYNYFIKITENSDPNLCVVFYA